MTARVTDRAMQLFGGGGVSQEFPLAAMWANARSLRFADGPDEVHRRQISRLELRKHSPPDQRHKVPLSDHYALRTSSCPRRVQHIREALGPPGYVEVD